MTLSAFCEVAALGIESGQRADLAAALESACQEGRAVLLLDGLDECMKWRAVVAEGLRMILGSLPAETGVVVATRSSGVPAAERLGLLIAESRRPAASMMSCVGCCGTSPQYGLRRLSAMPGSQIASSGWRTRARLTATSAPCHYWPRYWRSWPLTRPTSSCRTTARPC